jgi:cytoskeletal protein CcmA (bactofilin family)
MFARKKPVRAAETSERTPALNVLLDAVATPVPVEVLEAAVPALPAPEPEAEAEPAPAPAPAPAAKAAAPTPPARQPTAAARPKVVSFLAGDLSFSGTLAGDGDLHLAGAFEGDIRVRDVTVSSGGRVEGVIAGRRVEVQGRVQGGVEAEEVRVRIGAQVDGDVTSESFALEAGARFEGRSRRPGR